MITKRMLHGSFGFDQGRNGRMGYFANYCPHCETKVFLDFNEVDKFIKRARGYSEETLSDKLINLVPYNVRAKIAKSLVEN